MSAGVMKGLQAVLVFVASHLIYCGRTGGTEMCFTTGKFLSLVTVTGGVTGGKGHQAHKETSGSLTGTGFDRDGGISRPVNSADSLVRHDVPEILFVGACDRRGCGWGADPGAAQPSKLGVSVQRDRTVSVIIDVHVRQALQNATVVLAPIL